MYINGFYLDKLPISGSSNRARDISGMNFISCEYWLVFHREEYLDQPTSTANKWLFDNSKAM